jgi:sialate O-acetylesterase
VRGGGALKGFSIAGADRKFHWADARIDGETILVSSPDVTQPAAVRYAWADSPECNLFNKEGLPASPFRTDDWPGITVHNH